MAYTESELEEQIKNKFLDNGIQDDLSNLASSVLAKYCYLHQIEDISTLLEGSFTRSKLLNSKIQHAVDNFYSVNRGNNRRVRVSNIYTTEPVNAAKYDLISTYGDFKLYYAMDCTHENIGQPFSFDAYLALGSATETFNGEDRLYHDLDGKNISEEIIITNSEGQEYKLTSYLSDLNVTEEDDSNYAGKIALITMPNYGVRLYKKDKFLASETYIVKYLNSPDESVKNINLSEIKTLPKFIKRDATSITEINATQYKLMDKDKIYLYTANSIKFRDTMKSINSMNTMIQEAFPEFKGFNAVINTEQIDVYYVIDYNSDTLVEESKVEKFKETARSYYITQNIQFHLADYASTTLNDYSVKIYYKDEINFDICKNIIEDYQSTVGENFNPYQIIADLMSNSELFGKIKQVFIPSDKIGIIQLEKDERIKFVNLTIEYESI